MPHYVAVRPVRHRPGRRLRQAPDPLDRPRPGRRGGGHRRPSGLPARADVRRDAPRARARVRAGRAATSAGSPWLRWSGRSPASPAPVLQGARRAWVRLSWGTAFGARGRHRPPQQRETHHGRHDAQGPDLDHRDEGHPGGPQAAEPGQGQEDVRGLPGQAPRRPSGRHQPLERPSGPFLS